MKSFFPGHKAGLLSLNFYAVHVFSPPASLPWPRHHLRLLSLVPLNPVKPEKNTINMPIATGHSNGVSNPSTPGIDGHGTDPIVITGFSLKFPDEATSSEGFWDMLKNKKCATRDFPLSRLNAQGFLHKENRMSAVSQKFTQNLLPCETGAETSCSSPSRAAISSRKISPDSMRNSSPFLLPRPWPWTQVRDGFLRRRIEH